MNANFEQLEFQALAQAHIERERREFIATLTRNATKQIRQIAVSLLGLDLSIPEEDRKYDGTGPAIPLALILNTPEMAKHLADQVAKASREKSAMANEDFDAFSRGLVDQLMGRDHSNRDAEVALKVATLSEEDLQRMRQNTNMQTEGMLRAAGITLETFQDTPPPDVSWDDVDPSVMSVNSANDADKVSSDSLLDWLLGRDDGGSHG